MSRLKVLLLSSCAQTGVDVSNQLAALHGELEIVDPGARNLEEREADAIFLDLDGTAAPGSEQEIFKRFGRTAPVIVLSSLATPALIVQQMRHGAADFVVKNELERLPDALKSALSERNLAKAFESNQTTDQLRLILAEREEVLAQLRVMLDRMPIGCILNDVNFRFTYWNPAAEKIFGFTFAEIKGRHPFGTITPPENEAGVGQIFRRLAAGDMSANGLGPNRTKDGRRIVCQWNNTPLRSADGRFMGILSMCQDVTARIQAEEAVAESEARFRQLAENIQECFWLSSVRKQQFVYVSPAFDKIWGFSRETLFQRAGAWLEAIHPDDRDRVERAIHEKEIPGTFNEEYRIVRPGGVVRWVRERAFAIRNSEGQIYRMAGLVEDETAQKELERQFLHAQKMESVGRLAGGVAHDFGNMLTAISSFSRLALDNVSIESPARSDLEQVLKAAERATAVTK